MYRYFKDRQVSVGSIFYLKSPFISMEII